MFIGAIVAMDNNNGIGYNNGLPWKLKGDLKRFKTITIGSGNNCVVMGKNTYSGIKFLPNRDNFILSSTLSIYNTINNNLIKSFASVSELMNFIKIGDYDEVWIIGGSMIYDIFLKQQLIDKLFITVINDVYRCDTFFPNIPNNFIITKTEPLNEKTERNCETKMCIYEKLKVGMIVQYKTDNNKWKIIEIHSNDYPDYYFTIQNENGREVQTVSKNIF